MRRRTFFKLVGAAACAGAAGGMLAGCEGASLPGTSSDTSATPAGERVSGQPALAFSTSVDALIVGSGAAGLSAAMPLIEAGYKVMVAEKLDVLGGESYESNAILSVVGSACQLQAGIELTADQAWKARASWLSSVGVTDLDAAKRLFYATADWADHLKDAYGARFADPTTYASEGVNEAVLLPKNGIGDMESVFVPLRDGLASKGVTFSTGYRATAFIVDASNKVCGMRFAVGTGAQTADVRARRVIVATGGFASDQALMRDYLPDWQTVGCITAASMGEGQRLCEALGAQLSGMDSAAPLIGDIPQACAWGLFARTLAVDALGNRFAREDTMGDVATACFRDGRGYWWQVFDGAISSSGQSRSAAQVASKNAKRMIGPFDDVAALAAGMGASEGVLRATFERYESMVDAGVDSDFGRTLHLEKLQPPYYALKQFPVRYRTRGGVKTDANGRALTATGTTMPNVYCCGAVASTSGEGLATNGAFGMLVGQACAADLRKAGDEDASAAEDAASADADAAADESADAATGAGEDASATVDADADASAEGVAGVAAASEEGAPVTSD